MPKKIIEHSQKKIMVIIGMIKFYNKIIFFSRLKLNILFIFRLLFQEAKKKKIFSLLNRDICETVELIKVARGRSNSFIVHLHSSGKRNIVINK